MRGDGGARNFRGAIGVQLFEASVGGTKKSRGANLEPSNSNSDRNSLHGDQPSKKNSKKISLGFLNDLHAETKKSILNNKNLLFERINSDFKLLSGLKNVNDLLDKASEMISTITSSERVTYFILDRMILDMFEKENKGVVSNIRVDNNSVSIALPNQKVKSLKKIARTDHLPTDLDRYLLSPDMKPMK